MTKKKDKLFKKFSYFHFESSLKNPPDIDGVVHPASLPLVEERQAAGGKFKGPGHVLVHCLLPEKKFPFTFFVSPEIPASEDLFFQANRSQANLVSMNLFGMKVHVLFSIPFFLASILTHS